MEPPADPRNCILAWFYVGFGLLVHPRAAWINLPIPARRYFFFFLAAGFFFIETSFPVNSLFVFSDKRQRSPFRFANGTQHVGPSPRDTPIIVARYRRVKSKMKHEERHRL